MVERESFSTKELTPTTWPDFEELFSKYNGVWGGCWCMYYHLQGKFMLGSRMPASKNRKEKQALVRHGRSHGIIVYANKKPVGWCQYGTKDELPRMDASRNYLKLDIGDGEKQLWRITCFFVDKDFRGKGVAGLALKAALASIRKKGGGVVEAYPLANPRDAPRKTAKGKASFLWSGTAEMFEREGFKVLSALGKSSLVMRRTIS